MTPELAKKIKIAMPRMPEHEQINMQKLLEEYEKSTKIEDCTTNFMAFVRQVWPTFIHGAHHEKMASAFERVVKGELKRLIINMPPRHTKSEFASYLLPAWFLGKNPEKKVIQTSHTAELAVGFGRKVRNLVDSEAYKEVFPELGLQTDSKAAGRWNTNKGGDYFAIGVGGAVTGKGADILIIDDPHSEQEAALAEVNPEVYDKTYEWYTSGPRQRLQPGGAIVIVMCMTGDTRVLLANGKEKELHSIKVGDEVATYDSGKITTSKVLNWQSNGFDFTYRITTNCNTIVYANERHPFLVDNNGVRQWIRLKDLKKGMLLVATRTVEDPHEHKQDREDFVPHAKQQPQNIEEISASSPDMGLTAQGILSYLKPKKVFVQCVKSLRDRMLRRTGVKNCVLTTATKQEKLEGCYVMTATSPSGMVKQKQSCSVPQNTYEIILEEITDVTPYGYEEVFDVEIERTENFIANGLVSHNTRWSKKDLTGRVIKSAAQRNDEGWEIIEFPALLPSGRPLWPEFWVKSELEALKLELPNSKWMAQYQQQPTSEESAIIKREWWNKWEKDDPPSCEFVIQSWDTAFLKTQRADYSACTTWGIFYREDATGKKQANIILLDVLKERMEFPELKETAKQMYKEWEPDALIVEAKASGAPLVFELRATGIPVQEFVPSRGNDKIARLNAVSDIFASGRVWVPETSWAEELVDEVASFPAGDHDDLVDSMTQALLRFRRGGFLQLDSDYDDEPLEFRRSKGKALYTV